MSVEVNDPLLGKKLGDYVIEALVGEGGMGLVYRAVHPLIGRKVAVKVLKPERASDPEQTERFLAEARALSAVKHRGVIDVISFGHLEDGSQYMVMEFLEGEALDAVLGREGSLSPVRSVQVVDEVLEALSAAHKAGVVHRDIKPSNVFLLEQSDGSRVVKVVDFGLARKASLSDLSRTSDKASLRAGTPEYISPEQVRGLAATPRSDLYSTGVMLFELLSGRLPFEDTDVMALIEAHVKRPAPPVSKWVGGLPDELVEVVAALLQKKPEDRPQSADVVRTRLARVLRELREQTTQVKRPPQAQIATVPLVRAAPTAKDTDTVTEKARPDTEEAVPPSSGRAWMVVAVLALAAVGLGGVLVKRLTVEPPSPRVETPEDPPPPREALDAGQRVSAVEEPEALPALPAIDAGVRPPQVAPLEKKRPVAVTPSGCTKADWQRTLKDQIAEAEQQARAANRMTPGAMEQLEAIYKALKAGSSCRDLEARLAQWRRQHVR